MSKLKSHPFVINGRTIGEGQPPYIIAEVSANHNGSIERAKATIKAAHLAGAHAVKMQTYTPDTMTLSSDRDDFQITQGLWKGYNLYRLYEEAHTPFEWHEDLFAFAGNLGITLFSTPFDESAVDLLVRLDAPAFKIASFELVDLDLIRYVAKQNKPMLISTGMGSVEETAEAVDAARGAGCQSILLFHCISGYPTPIDQANLANIPFLKKEFDVEVGLSDHTLDHVAAIGATVLGAASIEKHFTLDRAEKGPDSSFSIEPDELKQLVKLTAEAASSIGAPGMKRSEVEDGNKIFRRSLYFAMDAKKGDVVTEAHIRRVRPGFGLPPKHYAGLIGRRLARDISFGEAVSWDDFA
ncbi:pseudaminic acid synthase [uncultured Cohaesibacter sp.]|uniref:pseudaminic acid synthase n=1 Tax=uncultured Cohaesibacter sp. TaxID=1002546 RepID=UPI00292E33CB|nr:pseudaminic acid synthase [uncultured Cohaesibacter sp.]